MEKILKDDFSLVWGYPITIITDESNKVIYARHGDIQIDSNNILYNIGTMRALVSV